jgi:hypothetical protein
LAICAVSSIAAWWTAEQAHFDRSSNRAYKKA